MKARYLWTTMLVLAAAPAVPAQTPLGTAFTYQGQLKQSGSPANGSLNMTFKLFDASGGGLQIGPTLIFDGVGADPPPVSVTNGLFTVQLDFGIAPYDGNKRWLEIAVSGSTLSPRQELTAAPYARFSAAPWSTNGANISNTNTGYVGVGTSVPAGKLDVRGGAVLTDNVFGFGNVQQGASPVGVYLSAPATQTVAMFTSSAERMRITSGGNVGIGTASPTQKLDVNGGIQGAGISASGIGVHGIGQAIPPIVPEGRGVVGEATSNTGVEGISTSGVGVRAQCLGNNYGMYASTAQGYAGLYATGPANGVFGQTASSMDSGVYGNNTGAGWGVAGFNSAGADKSGVFGNSSAANGNGVIGEANNGSSAYGVWGKAAQGIGGYFEGGNYALIANGTARVNVLEIVGADLAEKFPVSDEVQPGMVVMIDTQHSGQLRASRGAYNHCVAGVVSGAGDLPVGAVLGHLPGNETAPPIALSGRVWTLCDARSQAIAPGDLLTTSDTLGYAMNAVDRERRLGTTLGKAMTGLARGKTGLVLVLVSLQ